MTFCLQEGEKKMKEAQDETERKEQEQKKPEEGEDEEEDEEEFAEKSEEAAEEVSRFSGIFQLKIIRFSVRRILRSHCSTKCQEGLLD